MTGLVVSPSARDRRLPATGPRDGREDPIMKRATLGTVLLVLALVMAASTATAEFYKDKTVRIVVSSSPGGATTPTRGTSRAICTGICPENEDDRGEPPRRRRSSGGELHYHSSRQDGTEILHIGGSSVIKQLTGMKQVRFDARQFQYFGAPYAEATVLVVTGTRYHELGASHRSQGQGSGARWHQRGIAQ